MNDLEICLDHRPGTLAEMGEALGKADISVEGGGGFAVDGRAVAHFLFHDGNAARAALDSAGIRVIRQRDVVALRLKQDRSGQLGAIARRMGNAGVNIEVVYSDHDGRLILVVDDAVTAGAVRDIWMQEQNENA